MMKGDAFYIVNEIQNVCLIELKSARSQKLVSQCANTNKLVTNANAAIPKNDDVNSSRDVTIKSVIFLAILN